MYVTMVFDRDVAGHVVTTDAHDWADRWLWLAHLQVEKQQNIRHHVGAEYHAIFWN